MSEDRRISVGRAEFHFLPEVKISVTDIGASEVSDVLHLSVEDAKKLASLINDYLYELP